MNAYELADLMLDVTDCESSEYYQAGVMLRQQADRIAELEKAFVNQRTQTFANSLTDGTKATAMQQVLTKPLSDEEIEKLWYLIMVETAGDWEEDLNIKFAKAIEERHGIK